MKKITKKLIKSLACMLFLITSTLNVNAEEVSTEMKVSCVEQTLIQNGINETVIENMSIPAKLGIYEKMQTYDLVVSDAKREIVSFEDSINKGELQPYGTISNSTMSMDALYFNYLSNNKIREVECYYYSQWLHGPIINTTDGLTMNWDSSLFSLSQMVGRTSFNYSGQYYDGATITRAASASQGGFGINVPLVPSSQLQSLEVTVFLVPRNTLKTTPVTTSNINFEYAHRKFEVGPAITFTKTGASIGMSPSSVYDTGAVSLTYYSNQEIIQD